MAESILPQLRRATAADAEAVADMYGPIHDLVRSGQRAWMDALAELACQAQGHGKLAEDADVDQLGFELQACLELANYHFVLFGDAEKLERGRRAVAGILQRHVPARRGARRHARRG